MALSKDPNDGHVHLTITPRKTCELCGVDTSNMTCIGAA